MLKFLATAVPAAGFLLAATPTVTANTESWPPPALRPASYDWSVSCVEEWTGALCLDDRQRGQD